MRKDASADGADPPRRRLLEKILFQFVFLAIEKSYSEVMELRRCTHAMDDAGQCMIFIGECRQ